MLSSNSGIAEKVDNFRMESVDNFDRNRWTTSNGMDGQLQMEWPVNIDRNTHNSLLFAENAHSVEKADDDVDHALHESFDLVQPD
jgi:hypothetical protein